MTQMIRSYTTGELAKLCQVSVRTIQYYDKKNILVPSGLTEGGRRLYSDKDLEKMRCICLYKILGFSLEDISKVMNSADSSSLLSDTIQRQLSQLEDEIVLKQQTRQRLAALLQQIEETGQPQVESIEEMEGLLNRKQRHRKTDIMTYLFLGCYVLFILAGAPIAASLGGIAPIAMVIAAVALLCGLIYYHSQVNSYVCPQCSTKFSISFFRDMISPNGGRKGKYLTCPHCARKGWFKETFPDH